MHPPEAVAATLRRLYQAGFTTTSGGNLSLRVGGDLWITPAALDKGTLQADQVVCVRPDGTTDSALRPSSELPFHRAILDARPDVRAIVHAHSSALIACSAIGRMPDTLLVDPEGLCAPLASVPYALPGSASLGSAIAAAFAKGASCVLLENHGAVTAGPDLRVAHARFETFEQAARATLVLDELRTRRHPPAPRLASGRSLGPMDASSRVAQDLAAFVRRASTQGLLTPLEGWIGVREADGYVLPGPTTDRGRCAPRDLLRVEGGWLGSLFAAHPWVQAVAGARPPTLAGFAASGVPVATRILPEAYLVLRDLPLVPPDPEALVQTLSPRCPAVLVEGGGVITVGTSTLQAFDRLEVAERTAQALLLARRRGEVRLMEDRRIHALIEAWGLPT